MIRTYISHCRNFDYSDCVEAVNNFLYDTTPERGHFLVVGFLLFVTISFLQGSDKISAKIVAVISLAMSSFEICRDLVVMTRIKLNAVITCKKYEKRAKCYSGVDRFVDMVCTSI